MTVQELMQSALYDFSQDPSNSRFGDCFYRAINDSQNELAISRNWGFLRTSTTLTCVADIRTIALPTDFGKPYRQRGALRITTSGYSGDTIELMTEDEWVNDYYEDGSDTDEPSYAYIGGSLLYLSPIPDAAYTISFPYYKLPASVADTSSVITTPSQYHELLKKMMWRRLQVDGFNPIVEIQISDADISKMINKAARDDISKYGGMTFNLNSSTYSQKTY